MRVGGLIAPAGLAGLLLIFAAAPAFALPDVHTPIDPTKRASISTRDAVSPTAKALEGNGVIGGRVFRMAEIPLKPAAVGERRASIQVEESREKRLIQTETRAYPVRAKTSDRHLRAGDLPASIPRLSADQFSRIIAAYRKGAVPAREWVQGEIRAADDGVSLGEINRYASPRRALEEQGIPVRQAGQSEEPPTAEEAGQPMPWPEAAP